MKGKYLLLVSIIAMMIIGMLPVMVNAAAAGTIALKDSPINIEAGNEASVLPSWPDFDLTVEITDVTNAVAVAFSLEWDTTYFNCTGAVKGDVFEPGGGGGTYFALPNIKNDLGEFHEASYTQLAPYDPQNLTDPTWGLVATVHFKYVGTTPSLGTTITTYINFTNYDTGALMRTYWAEKQAAPVPLEMNFTQALSCEFNYEGPAPVVKDPVAHFTYSPSVVYVGESVNFDASTSEVGKDGNSTCPITEYSWDFDDDGPTMDTDPFITHAYTAKGTYHVCLNVTAPAIGWADPSYNETSAPFCMDVIVLEKLASGIDVYTEWERWPGYTAYQIGEGLGQPADAYSPQENVTVCANVTWNGAPVQNKLVGFEVHGPPNSYLNVSLLREATANSDGIACITFRIPWPCDHAEDIIFGTWGVNVSVSLAEHEFTDWLTFEVGWIVELISVETENPTYKKAECINVTVTVKNIAMDDRDALLALVVYDDVGAVIARYYTDIPVPSGTAPKFIECHLPIPKFAYVGPNCIVYANAFIDWPHNGGTPWCPEVSDGFIIEYP